MALRLWPWPGLLACAVLAQAAPPSEVFRLASHHVLLLETQDPEGQTLATASAVQVAEQQVVTQCDLIEGAAVIRVVDARQRGYRAYFKAADPQRNWCRLSVPGLTGKGVLPAPGDGAVVGAPVYAIGNALGLGLSLSEGVLAALRERGGRTWLQFTAPISPGSEGGGLFDAQGRLLGLVHYRKRDGQNINFATPASVLERMRDWTSPSGEVRNWEGEAETLAGKQDGAGLLALAQAWRQAAPDRPEPWFWLGEAMQLKADLAAALEAYRQSLARDPDALRVSVALTATLIKSGRAEEAMELLRQARHGEQPILWLLRGNAEEALQRPDAALQAYREAIRLDGWYKPAWVALYRQSVARRDWGGARAALQSLSELEPGEPAVWQALGDAYLQEGRPRRAYRAYDQARELRPESPEAWVGRGVSLARQGRPGQAVESLKRGIELRPNNPHVAWAQLGHVYYELLEMYPEAIAAYREAARLAAADAGIQASLGVALKDGNHPDEALAIFERLRARDPKDPFAWRQVGYVHAQRGRIAEAIPALERSLELEPNQAKVWHVLGELYSRAGRREDLKRVHLRLQTLHADRAAALYRAHILPGEGE